MVLSVAFCCDFLMTQEDTQRYHLRWFSQIAGLAVRDAIDIPVFEFTSGNLDNFSRERFFALSDMIAPQEGTHRHFDVLKINDISVEYLRECLGRSLLIGYELSEETRAVLDRAGIGYIDVWLHPIRFLPDNFYAFRSNIASVNECMKAMHMPSDVYNLYARRLKVQTYMGWNKHDDNLSQSLSQNAALFVGQTLTDKAVCREGKMLSVLDFEFEFEQLTRKYNHVYFSRHPMIRGDDSNQLAFVKQFYNVSLVSEPGYSLLCNDNIEHVCAISSSLVYEASFFGKTVEYFYRPALSIWDQNNPEGYFSLYGLLHQAKFWAEILKPLCEIKDCVPQYDFFEKGNIYRDMLSLYYNNHVFDKEHATYLLGKKLEKTRVSREITNKNNGPSKKPVGLMANDVSFDKIKSAILNSETVSFDIFDTLLHRSCVSPGDVPRFALSKVSKEIGVSEEQLVKARFEAKRHSDKIEVPLFERYKIVEKTLDLPNGSAEILTSTELEVDRAVLSARPFGKAIYNYAKELNKRIIVVSDIFYPLNFIAEILKREGLEPDAYYISSELNATKEDGSLFDVVKSIEQGSIVHIGDNYSSDYIRSIEKGIPSIWISSEHAQLKKSLSSFVRNDTSYSSFRDGAVQQYITAYPAITNEPGYSAGDATRFGYTVVGDIMLSFAAWVVDQALKDNIDTLYFLARDGEIVKKVVDVILEYNSNIKIKTQYLLASRRSLRVVALKDITDIKRELDSLIEEVLKNRSPSTTREYLSMRFGIDNQLLDRLGVDQLPSYLNSESTTTDLETISKWILSDEVVSSILANAKLERDAYLGYLQEMGGLTENVGFVDIGHNGSLQSSLSILLGLERSRGYYFATYRAIDGTMKALRGDHRAIGYYRDRVDNDNKNDMYIKYALVVESLFLNDKETFLRFTNVNGVRVPQYSPGTNITRIAFNKKIHVGAVNYTKDVLKSISEVMFDVDLGSLHDSKDVCQRLFTMLVKPVARDAKLFSGVTLENFFAGKSVRYFVPLPTELHTVDGIWGEGTRLLRRIATDGERRLVRSPEELYVEGNYSLAAKAFESFHTVNNPNPNALRRAAEVYLQVGERERAIKLLMDAKKFLPNNARLNRRIMSMKYPILEPIFKGKFRLM